MGNAGCARQTEIVRMVCTAASPRDLRPRRPPRLSQEQLRAKDSARQVEQRERVNGSNYHSGHFSVALSVAAGSGR